MPDTQPQSSRAQVIGVVAFYMIAALVMVFINKLVLTSSPSLPILFMFNQLILTVVLLHTSSHLFPTRIPSPPKFSVEMAKKLAPLLVIDAAGLVFNALCLRGVEAAFFQIARGLTLPFTILVQSIHTRSIPASKILLSAGIVTTGFLLGVSPTSLAAASLPSKSVPAPQALIYGLLSSLIIAIHAVQVKSSLPLVNNSAIQLAFWTQTGSAVICFVAILLDGEASLFLSFLQAMRDSETQREDMKVFFWGSLVTGFFGFLISVAAILSVKVTSPVTHMFSSAARTVLQALLGVWFFQDVLTVPRATSLLTIMTGTLIYTYIKSSSPPPTPSATIEAKDKDLERGLEESQSMMSDDTLFVAEGEDGEEREEKV